MKRTVIVLSGLLLSASTAFAQPPPAGAPTTVAIAIQRAYATIKTNLTQAAEKMPEANYDSKPSTMPEMRTYGQLFAHVAQSQFGTCAVVRPSAAKPALRLSAQLSWWPSTPRKA